MEKKSTDILIHMGQRIKMLRLQKCINQEDFAATLNLSRASICNIEKGIQSISHQSLLKACSILGVSPNEIYPNFSEPVQLVVVSKENNIIKRKKSLENRLIKIQNQLKELD